MKLKFSQPGSTPLSSRISQDYLREVVEKLAFPRVFGTPANHEARDLVAAEFHRFGECRVVGEFQNVLSGDLKTAEILIGAHYDSVPLTPGADDNASAVAVMLAVMRALSASPRVAAVAFNCEEYRLEGSREFVAALPVDHRLREVHVLEMVGFCSRAPNSQKDPIPGLGCPTTGDFLGIVGNDETSVDRILQAGSAVSVPVVGLALPQGIPLASIGAISPHLLRSDHAAFWEQPAQGIAANLWTDTSEFRNPHYHQPTDAPETLDYTFMTEVAELLLDVISSGA